MSGPIRGVCASLAIYAGIGILFCQSVGWALTWAGLALVLGVAVAFSGPEEDLDDELTDD